MVNGNFENLELIIINYLKKLASFSIGTLITALISALSIPVFTRILNPSDYGEVNLFITIGTIIGVISLGGFDQGFIRFYSNSKRINLFIRSLILSSFFLIGSSLLITFISVQNKELFSFNNSAMILILYVAFTVILRYFTLILRMQQEGLKYSVIQVLTKLFEFITIFIFLSYWNNSTVYYLIGIILSQLIVIIVALFITNNFWETNDSDKKKIENNDLLSYSIPLLFAGIITILFQSADKLIISNYLSLTELGIYIAAFKIVALLNILQTTFTLLWTPVSFEKYHENLNNRDFFAQISSYVTMFMFLLAGLIMIFKEYIVLMLGSEYREAVLLIPFLIFIPVMFTISETTVIGINFKLKSYWHILISSIILVFLISLMVFLIPNFGLIGAAISINLSYVLFFYLRTFIGFYYYRYELKLTSITILIILFYLWIIVLYLYPNFYNLMVGGIIYFISLFQLYKTEFLMIFSLIKKRGIKV